MAFGEVMSDGEGGGGREGAPVGENGIFFLEESYDGAVYNVPVCGSESGPVAGFARALGRVD